MQRRRKHSRAGFTLIEIMMVVAIMIFLIALTVAAVKNVLGSSRVKATQATIRKIDGLLTRRIEAFERDVEERTGFSNTTAQGVQKRKTRMKEFFPQTHAEAGISPTSGSTNDPSNESAEALYHFLVKSEAVDTEDLDSDAFSPSEVRDTDGDGLPEFVDAWERPLRFYRWPTRLIRPALDAATNQSFNATATPPSYGLPIDPDFLVFTNASIETGGASARILIASISSSPGQRGPNSDVEDEEVDPLAKDADDPLGFTRSPTSSDAANYEDNLHTPETWTVPLIVSVGPDGELGLHEPHDKANHGHLAQPDPAALQAILDNITNRNLQAGGQ